MDKKLGLGCMRLPLTNPDDVSSINIGELSRMVDLLIENGFTYFDTAYTYHDGHCETALRKALVERYPRNAYSLTDKLPTLLLESEEQQERIFAEQLERCGVEYFDRYLVHCATAAFYEKAERFRSFEFAIRKKREGLTRMIGFSYHDSPELLGRHPHPLSGGGFRTVANQLHRLGAHAYSGSPVLRHRATPRETGSCHVSAQRRYARRCSVGGRKAVQGVCARRCARFVGYTLRRKSRGGYDRTQRHVVGCARSKRRLPTCAISSR